MPSHAEDSVPYHDDAISLTPFERRLLQADRARRALRAAQAAETRWVRDVLGHSGAGASNVRLAQSLLRSDKRRPPS